MNTNKQTIAATQTIVNPMGEITQLIDLFVDMCFDDIKSTARISQFRLIGIQMGYTPLNIDKVIDIGKSEYQTLLDEINQDFVSSVEV